MWRLLLAPLVRIVRRNLDTIDLSTRSATCSCVTYPLFFLKKYGEIQGFSFLEKRAISEGVKRSTQGGVFPYFVRRKKIGKIERSGFGWAAKGGK